MSAPARSRRRAAPLVLLASLFAFVLVAAPPPASAASAASGGNAAAPRLLARAEADFAALQRDTKLQRLRQSYDRVLERYRQVFDGHPKSREAEAALLRAGEVYRLLHHWTSLAGDLNRAQNYWQRLVATYPRSNLADDAQLAIGYLLFEQAKDEPQAYLAFARVAEIAPRGDKAAEAARMAKKLARHAPPPPPPTPTPEALTALACPTPGPAAAAALAAPAGAPPASEAPAKKAAPEPLPGMPTVLGHVVGVRNWSNPEYTRVVIHSDRRTNFYANLLDDPSGTRPPRLYVDLFGSLVDPKLCQPITVNDGILRTIRIGQFTADSVRVVLDIDRLQTYRIFPMESPFRIVIDVTGGEAPRQEAEPTVVVGATAPPANPGAAPGALGVSVATAVAPVAPPAIRPLPGLSKALTPPPAEPAPPSPPPAPAPAPPPEPPPAQPPPQPAPAPAEPPTASAPAPPPAARISPPPKGDERLSLARQLGLGISRIVIDAGHGAHDPGAIGVGGLKEKDVTLDIALRVRDILDKDGFQTVLTRERDVYLPLEERTAIANKVKGDLFLSIHCNSSDRGDLRGVETYYLNLASSRRAMATAARENSMAMANMSDLNKLVRQIFTSKMDESSRFADQAQRSLHRGVARKFRDAKDLGVKQAPFYVLIGAEMPSILAEVSFINHKTEGKRLADPAYRQLLAEALADGVRRYVKTVKTAAAPRTDTGAN